MTKGKQQNLYVYNGGFLTKVCNWLKPGGVLVFNLGRGDDSDAEGAADVAQDFLGAAMAWSAFSRDTTAGLVAAAGLELLSDEVKVVSTTDAVDEEGLGFRFYTCRKPAQ